MTPRHRLGWPIELVKGRPFLNFLRILLHTDIGQTWRFRKGDPVIADSWFARHLAASESVAEAVRVIQKHTIRECGITDNVINGKDSSAECQRMAAAIYAPHSGGYICPSDSCGAVLDWKNEAPLRCTYCHQPLAAPKMLREQKETGNSEEKQSL